MTVEKFLVFDVESIGLHGEGFAVAWVVVNREGEQLDEGCLACDPAQCAGTDESRLWIGENVPPLEHTSPTKQHLRNTFWYEWRRWADQGAVLVADCAWPVEANFLSACVKLNHAEREWQGPYPLHDLASVLLALGVDALAVTERLPDELPAHHPLMDARQSARQLVAALKGHNAEITARQVRVDCPVIGLEQQEKNMSGGSFDYACYRTMQFADDLRNKLQEQGKDPSGEGWPNATWPTDVACKLSEIAAFADYVGALMKEAEWLYSGDTGEGTFSERVRKIEATRGVMRLERLPYNAGDKPPQVGLD